MNFPAIGQSPCCHQQQQPNPQMMGSNPMMQMMQMMMQLMMMMMAQMGGQMGGQMGNPMGGGMSPGINPGFGGGGGGFGGGGVPGFGGFSGGSPAYGGGSPGVGGGGGGGQPGYVPSGQGQVGQIGDIGTGAGSDAVRWALSKEGISEQNNPAAVRAFSRGRVQPWCADFVSQAYANSPGGSPFGHQSAVAGILSWGRSNNRFFSAGAAAANPSMLKPGDIATWKQDGKSHVGLVTGINKNGTFNTIEGNTSKKVARRTHTFGAGLTGFVRPKGSMP